VSEIHGGVSIDVFSVLDEILTEVSDVLGGTVIEVFEVLDEIFM
jgi:hypothetical protein